MRPASSEFLAATKKSHSIAVRVSVLDRDLTILASDLPVVGGGVTIDRTRDIKRTCTLDFANPGGLYTPEDQNSLFSWSHLVRVERGIRIGAGIEYVTLGTFMIDEPEVNVDQNQVTLSINGRDRFKAASESSFTTPRTYGGTSRVRDVVYDTLTEGGIVDTGSTYNLDDGGATLGGPKTFDVDTERLAAILSLTTSHALDLFADANGNVVLRPTIDPDTIAPVWSYTRGPEATLLSHTKRWSDSRLYNHVMVVGTGAGQDPIRAEAKDLNLQSPAYIYGGVGDRLFVYTSAFIHEQSQAQSVANALLPEVALIEETYDISAAPNPALEAGDVVTLIDTYSRTNNKLLLDSVKIPLLQGGMSFTSKVVRTLT